MYNIGSFNLDNFIFATTYISVRAIFFYSLFHFLYKKFNSSKGICKDLPSKRQLKEEKIANVKINVFEIFVIFLVFSSGILIYHSFSWLNFIATFIFCYLFFELWFYSSHRLMHTKKFRFLHKTHHIPIITTPLSALTMSLGEKIINDIGLLIVPSILSHFIPISTEGLLFYHLYNFYINVLGHSNLELMPKSFLMSKFGQLFSSSTSHSIHHHKSQYNFGLFTTIFDRAFNTYDPHHLEIISKVITEKPQTRKSLHMVGKKV